MQRQNPRKKKIVLGLTGSFGTGKSSVASIFRSAGAEVIDADRIAHECLESATPSYKKIVRIFGKNILLKDGKINRPELGRMVFNNKNLLKKLNSIVHPFVVSEIKKQIKLSKEGLIVLDAPLLIEAGLKGVVDKLIVVKATQEEQIQRLLERSSLSKFEILKRIKAQIPLREKARLADFVIDNSGSISETKKQVERIRRKLWKN